MKVFPAEIVSLLSRQIQRPRSGTLFRFLAFLGAMIVAYAVIFKVLMAREGVEESWVTAFYWVLTVMSTLGFGDITFAGDLGRLFSIVVLGSGMIFLLVLLPFVFIEFFYQPWMEAQSAARIPKSLPAETRGHVILTNLDPVSSALIDRLEDYGYKHVLIVPDPDEALQQLDRGHRVVVGDLDLPRTYEAVGIERAVLLAATGPDAINTNVAFTAREVAPNVRLIATANDTASIDVLELAGCDQVFHLADQMGFALARRVSGGDIVTHPMGEFDDLVFAEANAARTPLVGRTLPETGLRARAGVTVIGISDRGVFHPAGPDLVINDHTVLLLAGTKEQLLLYDQLYANLAEDNQLVLIIGGGRVGRAAARAFSERGIEYRIVERDATRPGQNSRWVIGNAAELETLREADLERATSVLVTTHDDAVNVYLTLYISKLRPDVQILSRSVRQRNLSTLHRAGADIVLSYASMGVNFLLSALDRSEVIMIAEGLILFRVDVPSEMVGKTHSDCSIREKTGATVVAVQTHEGWETNPKPDTRFVEGSRLVLIGNVNTEHAFLSRFANLAKS